MLIKEQCKCDEDWPPPTSGTWGVAELFSRACSALDISLECSSCKGESAPRTQEAAAMEKDVDAL